MRLFCNQGCLEVLMAKYVKRKQVLKLIDNALNMLKEQRQKPLTQTELLINASLVGALSALYAEVMDSPVKGKSKHK